MTSPDLVRIGVGAGSADDRIEPAMQLLKDVPLDYLVCECLAERTIARESLTRKGDPDKGYTPMLEARMRSFLPLCRERGVRIVTNMGAANPLPAKTTLRHLDQQWPNYQSNFRSIYYLIETGARAREMLASPRP